MWNDEINKKLRFIFLHTKWIKKFLPGFKEKYLKMYLLLYCLYIYNGKIGGDKPVYPRSWTTSVITTDRCTSFCNRCVMDFPCRCWCWMVGPHALCFRDIAPLLSIKSEMFVITVHLTQKLIKNKTFPACELVYCKPYFIRERFIFAIFARMIVSWI